MNLNHAAEYARLYKAITGTTPTRILVSTAEYKQVCAELGKDNLRSGGWPVFYFEGGPIRFEIEPLFDRHERPVDRW